MANIGIVDSPFTSNKPYLFRALYEWLLDNDATPYILVDANRDDVSVPSEHVKDGQIVLNAAPSAINHWVADNEAISFSARFSGKAFPIYVPTAAILAIYAKENGMGMAFPPEENQQEEPSEKQMTSVENVSKTSEDLSEINTPKQATTSKKENKKNSHLKIVK